LPTQVHAHVVALLIVGILTGLAHADADLPRRGQLGVRLGAADKGAGVAIESITPGSAAEEGGIRAGDVILMVDGTKVDTPRELMALITPMRAGRKLDIMLDRGGQRVTLPVRLKERPRDRGINFEVLYHHVVSGGARIRTMVSRPTAPGRHPALFFIPGMGPVSLDEPLSGSRAESRILNAFADAGYVTMRVEKPGIGDSEGGPYADIDFEVELDTYRQALKALKQYDFVDPNDVFVFGHSIGGVFAPVLAAETPVRGVAVYGTMVKTFTEYMLENTRRQARLFGNDPSSVDVTLRRLAIALYQLVVEGQDSKAIAAARPELGVVLERFAPGGRINGRIPRFWAQATNHNLPGQWAKGDAFVLAIWGNGDFIATEADHPLIADIVNRARPGKGAAVVLDGVDHGFRKVASLEDAFRRWGKRGEFAPQTVTTLKAWVEKVRRP
jgi:pimeloyl-ACP methyl ester carboxylesterase